MTLISFRKRTGEILEEREEIVAPSRNLRSITVILCLDDHYQAMFRSDMVRRSLVALRVRSFMMRLIVISPFNVSSSSSSGVVIATTTHVVLVALTATLTALTVPTTRSRR